MIFTGHATYEGDSDLPDTEATNYPQSQYSMIKNGLFFLWTVPSVYSQVGGQVNLKFGGSTRRNLRSINSQA